MCASFEESFKCIASRRPNLPHSTKEPIDRICLLHQNRINLPPPRSASYPIGTSPGNSSWCCFNRARVSVMRAAILASSNSTKNSSDQSEPTVKNLTNHHMLGFAKLCRSSSSSAIAKWSETLIDGCAPQGARAWQVVSIPSKARKSR